MSIAIENTLPGVTALVNEGQVSRPLQRQPTSTLFAVGFANYGPAGVPTVVTSFADYVRKFGKYHSLGYLTETAKVFFDHFGGSQMVVCRAVGSNPQTPNYDIDDTIGDGTYEFRGLYPSNVVDIKIVITAIAGDNDNRNFVVSSKYLGITETYEKINLREAAQLADFNANSKLVTAAVSGVAAGADGLAPAGTYEFDLGDDGSSGFDTTTFGTLLSAFEDENLGTGQVAIPGYSNATNNAALIAHAETYNRLALLDSELGDIHTDIDVLNLVSSYAAIYFPWVEMQALDGSSGKKFYPPSIFAAGACAKVDRTVGTHKAPANLKVPLALDVERNADGTSVINDGVREFLNGKNINVIAPLSGEGIKIYGGRVLAPSGDTRIRFVHERRVLNLIYYTAKIGYRWAVFAVVDGNGRLFRDLVSSGRTFLRNLWNAGALFGRTEQDAFIVIADETNNPSEELENGRVHVQLGVKLSPTAEVIFVNIDNVPLSGDLNVLNGGNE